MLYMVYASRVLIGLLVITGAIGKFPQDTILSFGFAGMIMGLLIIAEAVKKRQQ